MDGCGTKLRQTLVGYMVRSKASMWRWRDGSSIRLGCSNRQRQYSRTPAGGNMADGWTCPYASSYFRTRCKQRWEWVHGSKPVTLVRWQAGKAVNASRFPCASPSAKAEGSADIYYISIYIHAVHTISVYIYTCIYIYTCSGTCLYLQ